MEKTPDLNILHTGDQRLQLICNENNRVYIMYIYRIWYDE